MELFGIIALIVLGLIFVIVELFVMFGSVKIGTLGLICLGFALWLIYGNYGPYYGNLALGTTLVSGTILLFIAIRIMSNREVGLTDTLDEARVNVIDTQNVKVGDVGIAASDLKLGGRIRVNGETYDAESIDKFIDDGTKIMVTKVNSFQIFVKSVDDEQYMGT